MSTPRHPRPGGASNGLFAFATRVILFPLLFTVLGGMALALPQKIGDLNEDGIINVLDLVALINYVNGDPSFLPQVPVATVKEREEFLDVTRDGSVTQADVDALADVILEISPLPDFPPTRLTEASPTHGEESVSPARTVILRFSRRINPATITSNSVYLIANGARLAGRLEISSTATFATFFPSNPFPASTEIRLVVDGNFIRDIYGLPVDPRSADGSSARIVEMPRADEPSALRAQFDFRTLPLFRIPGTAVSGYVLDSYRTNADGTHVPIIGATIRVDAFPEANAVTDERGFFTLTNMPAPEFFVHVDGTATINGTIETDPGVGIRWHFVQVENQFTAKVKEPKFPA